MGAVRRLLKWICILSVLTSIQERTANIFGGKLFLTASLRFIQLRRTYTGQQRGIVDAGLILTEDKRTIKALFNFICVHLAFVGFL